MASSYTQLPGYTSIGPKPARPLSPASQRSLRRLLLLLLAIHLWLANALPPQLDLEHALEIVQYLLVWRRAPALIVGDDGGRLVDLGRQVLLRHGRALVVFGLAARLLDGVADGAAHRFGLDDVFGPVDLG
jgi:hypothetical protein